MAQLLVQLNDRNYPCEIVPSTRARYLRLKLAHSGVLSVVVPQGIGLSQVKGFVASQAQWIERNLAQLTPSSNDVNQLTRLNLTYLGEVWSIHCVPDPSSSLVEVSVIDNLKLECNGSVNDSTVLQKALGIWLKGKAEKVIPDRLAVLAEEYGFHFNKVTLRGQKTRWGSCSSKKNINLNYKLLFLEPAVVDYVLIHELCHTIEMNHSQRFWDLVADCDANYRWHDKQLSKLAQTIPI